MVLTGLLLAVGAAAAPLSVEELPETLRRIYGGTALPSLTQAREIVAGIELTIATSTPKPLEHQRLVSECVQKADWDGVLEQTLSREVEAAYLAERLCARDLRGCVSPEGRPACSQAVEVRPFCGDLFNTLCIESIGAGARELTFCCLGVKSIFLESDPGELARISAEGGLDRLARLWRDLFLRGDTRFCTELPYFRDNPAGCQAAASWQRLGERACAALNEEQRQDCIDRALILSAASSRDPSRCGGNALCRAVVGAGSACLPSSLAAQKSDAFRSWCAHRLERMRVMPSPELVAATRQRALAQLALMKAWIGYRAGESLPPGGQESLRTHLDLVNASARGLGGGLP